MIDEVKIIINWLSEDDDELNQYRLRLCWLSWTKVIVIVSDITGLPGRKIADIMPQIICWVSDLFDLFPTNIMLVEHYPISSLREDLYLHVLYVNNEAMRYEISEDKLMGLIYNLMY